MTHQAGPGSALAREINDGQQLWGVAEYLLAAAVDLLAAANWQRQGKKSAPKPKPVPRPGQAPAGTKYGRDPIPVKDFNDWWNNPEGGPGHG